MIEWTYLAYYCTHVNLTISFGSCYVQAGMLLFLISLLPPLKYHLVLRVWSNMDDT